MTPQDLAKTHAAAFSDARAWTAEEFRDLLASPLVFVCGDGRAFALVRVVADEAELLTLATHPNHRRQGLARARMAAWLDEAARRGATSAFLEVASDNHAARALYAATGFVQTGLRRGYYARPTGPAADAVMMTRAVTAGQPSQART